MDNQQSNNEGKTQEKQTRRLSKAEVERAERFAKMSSEFEARGYRIENLTVSSGKANLLGTLYGFIAAQPFVAAYFLTGSWKGYEPSRYAFLIVSLGVIVSIIVHELLHGTGWSLFTKDHFKSIAFGVVWEALMPYCTCREPLKKGQYIVGLVLPCIVLGVVPCIIACFIGSGILLGYGALMIVCAGGDLLVFTLILKLKVKGELLFLDHPTDVGLVAFVKDGK